MGLPGFSSIRYAEPADEDRLFEFLLLLHEENSQFPVVEHKVRDMIRHGTERRGGVIGIIDGSDRSIEASIGLVIEPWWYTDDLSLNERWNFVRQDCRKTKHAQHLIAFAKSLSDRLDMPLFMGIISTHRTEAKMRLYSRMMTMVGGFFMHGMKPKD